jgi:cytochrome c-type biogenesis protein CcmF
MFVPGVVAMWAAALALVGSTVSYLRAARGRQEAQAWARQFFIVAVVAVALASAALLYLILTHDFRYHYVFSYSDRSLPTSYLVSTFWAGQEGSFLLWLLAGMLIGVPLIRAARHYENRVMIFYNLTLLSLVAILLRQSPFRPLEGLPPGQLPFDGQGLNPLLQNPWMTIHPPVMFLGYAATAVPFAFAVAALTERRYDEWVRASLPWALVAVVTLGGAILLGGYWAYVTLGWGGYWGWDPVENSSLVPWLASAALVHGMLLQRSRGRFRKLNFSLAILSYVLVLYATFLTRSGVLADFSVHSFVDLGISGFLVANLLVFAILGFGVLLWRFREIPTSPGDEPILSRTVLVILAIALLLATAAVVLLGTSAPLITRLFGQPSQVGPAFYNKVTLPVGIVLALLLGVVPYLQWRGTSPEFVRRLALSLGLAALATVAAVLAGAGGFTYVLFLAASFFAAFSNLLKTVESVAQGRLQRAGGALAHLGLGFMLAGIVTSSAFDRTEKVVLPLGEGREVLGYTLTFRGPERGGARRAMEVQVRDRDGDEYLARPRLFKNEKSNQLVANPDVKVFLTHDLYLSPIEFDPGRSAEEAGSLELGKGETVTAGPYRVTFRGFEMGGGHGSGNEIAIGAALLVELGGTTHPVTPTLASTPNGFEARPATLPGAGSPTVRLTGVNASEGRIRIVFSGLPEQAAQAAQGEPMRLSLDVSTKPFIGLLWFGLVLLLAGGGLALLRRARDFATSTAEGGAPAA